MIIQFVSIPLLYHSEWTVKKVCEKLLDTLVIFIFNTMIVMLVSYIAKIRAKMTKFMYENLNLLDKMHEGVIVISEKERILQFASMPAIRLLKQLPLI